MLMTNKELWIIERMNLIKRFYIDFYDMNMRLTKETGAQKSAVKGLDLAILSMIKADALALIGVQDETISD